MAVLTWLWSILKGVLNMIAKLVVFAVIVVLVLAAIGTFSGASLPGTMVLELDLRQPMQDKARPAFLDLATGKVSILQAVLGLEAAARDNRVKGVFMRVGSGDLSVAQAEELRDVLKRFKQTGKFVIAHSQTFYSGGLGDYDVASIADQIWMQPTSSFFASGTASQTLFFKGLFDKVHAVPQFVQRYEYKNAANVFTQTGYTPAHREATTRVLQSWYDSATAEIAADRGMDKAALTALLDQSPSSVNFVKDKGLITAIGYDDDAANAAKARAGRGAVLVPFARYVHDNPAAQHRGRGPVIALVHAAGDIVEGGGREGLTSGGIIIAGDSFARGIRAATRARDVRAILLRVDSPGGSAIASDQILDALKKAKAAGKPIVVSMGSVAASGGYYISLAADKIVAEPGTLTGSIGVLWGKVAVGDSLALAGIDAREIGIGKDALFLSSLAPWNAAQLAAVNAQADLVYDDFTKKVAAGRHMALDKVLAVARGRVWTGADAKQRGLVDQLGGFWTAVDDVKQLAHIPAGTRVSFRDYPQAQGLFGRVSDLVDTSAQTFAAVRGLDTLLQSSPVRAFLAAVRDAPDGRAELRATGLPRQ